jgi:hypothetical protein
MNIALIKILHNESAALIIITGPKQEKGDEKNRSSDHIVKGPLDQRPMWRSVGTKEGN